MQLFERMPRSRTCCDGLARLWEEGVPFIAGAYIESQTGDIVTHLPPADCAHRSGRRRSDLVSDGSVAQRIAKDKALPIRLCARVIRAYWPLSWEICLRRTAKSSTWRRFTA